MSDGLLTSQGVIGTMNHGAARIEPYPVSDIRGGANDQAFWMAKMKRDWAASWILDEVVPRGKELQQAALALFELGPAVRDHVGQWLNSLSEDRILNVLPFLSTYCSRLTGSSLADHPPLEAAVVNAVDRIWASLPVCRLRAFVDVVRAVPGSRPWIRLNIPMFRHTASWTFETEAALGPEVRAAVRTLAASPDNALHVWVGLIEALGCSWQENTWYDGAEEFADTWPTFIGARLIKLGPSTDGHKVAANNGYVRLDASPDSWASPELATSMESLLRLGTLTSPLGRVDGHQPQRIR